MKKSGKPGVVVYFELRPAMKRLTAEQKGILFEAIMDYADDGIMPEFDDIALQIVWDFVQPRLDDDNEKYSNTVNARQEAANKRWGKVEDANASECNAKNANAQFAMQTMPTTTTTKTKKETKTKLKEDIGEKRARFSPPSPAEVDAYAKEQGYKLTRTTMQYTVSGINSYIQSIDEISPEAMAKMQSQAEDVIDTVFAAGQCQSDEYSTYTNVTQMVSKEYAGCYLFTLKEGYGVSHSYPANLIYVVYKVTATSTDGNFTYYYALRFRNGMLLEGTEFTIDLTDYDKTNDSFVKGYYTYTGKYFGSYDCEQSYYGYQDMASFKQSVMTDLVEKYSYTTNMQ